MDMDYDFDLVSDLLNSYDNNCKRVERHAMRDLFSLDVAVFNGLRDISPFNILTALRRMESWFGKVRTVEHSLCLVILTDYISCSYNQRSLYRTFENALTEKFVDSLFEKLYQEWSSVFGSHHLIQFTDYQLESLRKSLSRSVDRFPESFKHKWLLNRIVKLCENYSKILLEANLQNINCNLAEFQPLQRSSDKLDRKGNFHDANSSNILLKKRSSSDMTKYVVRKKHVAEELRKNEILVDVSPHGNIDGNITEAILPRDKEGAKSTILINNNDHEVGATSSSCISILSDDIINICDCCDKTSHTKVVDDIPKVTVPRKLNAFDILMKKVAPPGNKRVRF